MRTMISCVPISLLCLGIYEAFRTFLSQQQEHDLTLPVESHFRVESSYRKGVFVRSPRDAALDDLFANSPCAMR